jgi:phosphatidylinositol glycan class U
MSRLSTHGDPGTELRYPLLTFCVHLYTSILLPLLHDLWLVQGTGNANFFYAATMVYGLACGMGLVDMLGAGLRAEVGRKVVRRLMEERERRRKVEGEKVERDEKWPGAVTTETTMDDLGLVVVQYTTLDD